MKREPNNFWASAIRAGSHKQGKEYLRTLNDEYCVLGVLADLSVIYAGVKRTQDQESYLYDGHRFMLPPKAIAWTGMKNPHGFTAKIGKSLIELNNEKTLQELIPIIEKHWNDL